MERVEGIEPSTKPWQGLMLTVSTIPAYFTVVVIEGNDPSYQAYETRAYPSRLYYHNGCRSW